MPTYYRLDILKNKGFILYTWQVSVDERTSIASAREKNETVGKTDKGKRN